MVYLEVMGKPIHRLADLDVAKLTATCANCGPVSVWRKKRPESDRWQPGEWRYGCREAKRQQGRKDGRSPRAWAHKVKAKYGVTVELWTAMLIAQSGRCDICGDPMISPAVDHDHATGEVRSLLCSPCNTGLGHLGDDVVRLQAAIDYLWRHAPCAT